MGFGIRERNPERYLELSTKLLPLVAALNPQVNDYGKDKESMGRGLLKQIGFHDPDEYSIQAAFALQEEFIAKLEAIKAKAEGELQ